MFPLGGSAGAGLPFTLSFPLINARHNEPCGCPCSRGGEAQAGATGWWVHKLLCVLGAAVAQTNINHKLSCGLFSLWVCYNPGLWTLNQRMRDVGDGAWEQKGFPRLLVFCLENLGAPDLEGKGSAHPEPQRVLCLRFCSWC